MSDNHACRFYGGPLDGEDIYIPRDAHYYYKLLPPKAPSIAEEPAVPDAASLLNWVYKYERVGAEMYYVGEIQR